MYVYRFITKTLKKTYKLQKKLSSLLEAQLQIINLNKPCSLRLKELSAQIQQISHNLKVGFTTIKCAF